MMLTAVLIVSCLLLLLLGWFIQRTFRENTLKTELSRLREAEISLSRENAALSTELEAERRNLSLLKESEERLKKEFEILSARILESRNRVFAEQNSERLSAILSPFREQIEQFRQRVDRIHTEETAGNAKLLAQVKQLTELSNRVSDDANNLARAIKGESRTQGDWGEMIVQRIFEASGLVKGREYETQAAFRDNQGKLKRPDFIVNLPGQRTVIVDSKVSLTAYERYVNAQDEKTRELNLKAHTLSVRKHLEELRSKNYQDLLGNRSLDFVIMCIPLEPAWQAAFQADPNLIGGVSETGVVISGPGALMATLKLMEQLWRREKENRNAELIADRAGRLYDKVAGIVQALEDTRKKLDGASESLDLVFRRTSTGNGNLVSRVEELRRLGAKTSKSLPETGNSFSDNGKAPLQ